MRTADNNLSQRQTEILQYIQSFVEENGYPPAIRQIQDELSISSTSVVAYNLKALEQKGHLKREGKVSRGIKIPQLAPAAVQIRTGGQVPLLGIITAGQPLPDPEITSPTEAELISVPEAVAPAERLQDVYALKVRGYSMIDALINDGDIVLLRYQETAENGQMVAARIQDENAVTLKIFYNEGNRVRLQPANVTMDPIYVSPGNVRIEGRVVGVIRSMF
ncbi:transcriptional repressor LexA [Chloroflexia bacterium SDU3-3]|nr:transcriptional repressor LexA [Chloroflexia bacterium SDU3-3]